jgi:hypothetical protein
VGSGRKPGSSPVKLGGTEAPPNTEASCAARGYVVVAPGEPVDKEEHVGPMGAGTLVETASRNSKSSARIVRDGSANGNRVSSKDT